MKEQERRERVDLESKIAFLERTIEAMHEMALVQGETIDSMKLRIESLERQLRAGDDGEDVGPHDARPPHW